MAGENAARLVRDRAAQLARRSARARRTLGAVEAAEALEDLANEIAAISTGE